MVRIKTAVLGAVAAAALFGAGQASAKIMVATFYGVGTDMGPNVITSHDYSNVFGFGTQDNVFAGRSIEMAVTYDTNGAGRTTFPGFEDVLNAGPAEGTPNTFLNATITVDGVTLQSPITENANVALFHDAGGYSVSLYSIGIDNGYLEGFYNTVGVALSNPWTAIDQPYDGAAVCPNCATFQLDLGAPSAAVGQVDLTRFTITDAAGSAPEPAVWALMIAGFGLAGAALRHRRAIAAVQRS